MSVFRTNDSNEWRVYLDAFTLADVRKETGIDLADITAGGWYAMETDASVVGRVLAVVCADEIAARKMNGRQFARLIRGDVIEAARKALTEEGADFFPRSEWSAIRSNLAKRTKAASQTEAMAAARNSAELIPLLEAFTRLPPHIQEQLLKTSGDTSSLISTDAESAAGPDATLSHAATGSPESAELTAAG